MSKGWEGLPNISKSLYKETYFFEGETYEDWLSRITTPYQNNVDHGNRIREYIRKYWFHPATPISTGRGLPISCFVKHVPDDMNGIIESMSESMYLSAEGGGVGGIWSDVRGSGAQIGKNKKDTSSGVIPFLGVPDRASYGISQAKKRC
jgi:ribonucleoside-diphosphate reductase alpha chain